MPSKSDVFLQKYFGSLLGSRQGCWSHLRRIPSPFIYTHKDPLIGGGRSLVQRKHILTFFKKGSALGEVGSLYEKVKSEKRKKKKKRRREGEDRRREEKKERVFGGKCSFSEGKVSSLLS